MVSPARVSISRAGLTATNSEESATGGTVTGGALSAAQIDASRMCQSPAQVRVPRNRTELTPAGIGVQYDLKCSIGELRLLGCLTGLCQVAPLSRLNCTLSPMAVKRRLAFCGDGLGKPMVLSVVELTIRWSPRRIVNGVAGLIETLSQCHVPGVHVPSGAG